MLAFLNSIVSALTSLGDLILPAFGEVRNVRSIGGVLWWIFHFILLAGVLAGLWFLNYFLGLDKLLDAPYPILRRVWLPLLFLLLYLATWLAHWLWRLLGPGDLLNKFPDIASAWEEGLRALARAGIDLADAPVFLFLGQPAGTDEALFSAAGLRLQVERIPISPQAPIRLYANRDGIYVVCPGASLVARMADLLNNEEAAVPRIEAQTQPPQETEPTQEASSAAPPATTDGKSPEPTPAQEKPTEETRSASTPRTKSGMLLRDTDEVERLLARLQFVCWLIRRSRRPYCSVNGLVLLLPLAASSTEESAHQTALVCQRELHAAREMLGVHCPLLALICDLEKVPGFHTLMDRLPSQQRQRVLGQALPLVPDLPVTGIPAMVDTAAQWVFGTQIPSLVYRLLQLEQSSSQEERKEAIRGNSLLYNWLGQITQRQNQLVHLLTRGTLLPGETRHLFGGFYLAGTGHQPAREQAFAQAIFQRLLEGQNAVSWTQTALAEDAGYRRWIRMSAFTLAALLVLLVLVSLALFQRA
jgi:hypothetical protein